MIPSRAPPSSAFNKESNWLLDITQSPRSEGVGSKIQSSLIPATQPRRGLLSTSSDRLDYAIEVPIGGRPDLTGTRPGMTGSRKKNTLQWTGQSC